MKKLLFLFILIAAVFSVKYAIKKPQARSLLLDNIEALAADDEIKKPYICIGFGSVVCPATKDKVEYIFSGYSLEE